MTRSVNDVNQSISVVNAIINAQNEQVSLSTTAIQQNTNEYETLRVQKATLENTEVEVQSLCDNLMSNINDISKTYGSNNGFACGFAENTGTKVTGIQGDILSKLQSMVARIDGEMDICQTNIANAQNALVSAQNALDNAQSDLLTYQDELVEAKAQEETTTIAAATGM